jgi:hypothetical protein
MSVRAILHNIFGEAGWALVIVLFVEVGVTAFYLPFLLRGLDLPVPKKWSPITFNVVRVTVAVWAGTLLTSIARVVVWLRFKLAFTSGDQWKHEREDVLAIQNLSLWMLGLFTVLAAYLTQWFVEGG